MVNGRTRLKKGVQLRRLRKRRSFGKKEKLQKIEINARNLSSLPEKQILRR